MKHDIWPKGLIAITLVLSVSMVIAASNYYQVENMQSGQVAMHTATWSQQELQSVLQQLDKRLKSNSNDYEASLFKAMLDFNRGDVNQAIEEINALTQRAPDFHLAQLVKGDMLTSRFGPVSDIGKTPLLEKFASQGLEKLQQLRAEADARLKGMLETQLGNKLPMQLLGMGESTETAILVEKKYNRLYVYARTAAQQPPRLIRDYYVSTGKKTGNKQTRGDLRTPEGVYFVTSWIPDEKLPAKYGVGAFPVNYPNELDRKQGKTGNGIWLHGTDPAFYSRPPLDSEGCVVLPNIDLRDLKSEIKPGETPVIITEEVNWLKPQDWQQQRLEILAALEQWRRDWESMDIAKYLSHYSADFWSGVYTYDSWASRKRAIIRHKTYQRVNLSDIALFAYPKKQNQQTPLVVARFRQQYKSNNYSGDIHKRVYLRKDGTQWRILYEGT